MKLHKLLYSVAYIAILSGCGVLSGPQAPAPVASRSEVRAAPAPSVPPRAAAQRPTERSEALIQAIVALGTDYRYGGVSHANGFDCSGLVVHVYRTAWGLELPRTALEQSAVGEAISAEELKPGDLVFYNTLNRPFSHVGIYLGEGKFIHAPRTGAQVRTEKMASRYWSRRFDGARRIATADSPL